MYDQILFSIVLLSQVLLISLVFPRQVLERVRYVVKNYPPERYPRLYPTDLDQAERAQNWYRNANAAVLFIGLAFVGYTLYAPGQQLLSFRMKTLVMLYFLLQFAPMAIAATSGFTYSTSTSARHPEPPHRCPATPPHDRLHLGAAAGRCRDRVHGLRRVHRLRRHL